MPLATYHRLDLLYKGVIQKHKTMDITFPYCVLSRNKSLAAVSMKIIHVTNHQLILLESRRENPGGTCENSDHITGQEDDHLKAEYGRGRQLETNWCKHDIAPTQCRYTPQTQEDGTESETTQTCGQILRENLIFGLLQLLEASVFLVLWSHSSFVSL